jgi:hypothetical protein
MRFPLNHDENQKSAFDLTNLCLISYIVRLLTSRGEYPLENATAPFTSSDPFSIIEVGAGNGSAAKGILDHLKEFHPDLYAVTKYTIIDVSVPFHKRQAEVLSEHADRVKLINKSIYEFDAKVDTSFVLSSPILRPLL